MTTTSPPLRGKLKPGTRARLERLGRERALIYKTLVLTSLRKSELASITVGQVILDGPFPHLVLYAADERNRQGSDIPLRADPVADVRAWLEQKLLVMHKEAIRQGEEPPQALPREMPLFVVPVGLVRILDRGLKLAGIPKTDSRGWTVDVHGLRHTFGTLLSRGNVAPRVAQAAVRHSTIDLTMNVYTDRPLLDVAGALDRLPELPTIDPPRRGCAIAYHRPAAARTQLWRAVPPTESRWADRQSAAARKPVVPHS